VEVADEELELRVLVAAIVELKVLRVEIVLTPAGDDVVGGAELKESLLEVEVCRAKLDKLELELLLGEGVCRAELDELELLLDVGICREAVEELLLLVDEDEGVEAVDTSTEDVVEAEVSDVVERRAEEVDEDVGMVADFDESLCEGWEVDVDKELVELEEIDA